MLGAVFGAFPTFTLGPSVPAVGCPAGASAGQVLEITDSSLCSASEETDNLMPPVSGGGRASVAPVAPRQLALRRVSRRLTRP